jgi:hypothetical protein
VQVGLEKPEWLTPQIDEALAAIDDPHAVKKQLTVLLIAQALATGESITAVLERDDTCKSDIWYGAKRRNGSRKSGWREDPHIAAALQLATERARWWVRVKQGQAVQNALDTLIDVAEDAAGNIVSAIRYGQLVFLRADEAVIKQASVAEVLKASTEALDRISAATASKSTTEVIGMSLEEWRAAQKQRQQTVTQVLEDFADEE